MKRMRFFSLADLASDCVEDYRQGRVLLYLQTLHRSRNQWDQGVISTHEDYEHIGEV